MIFERVLIPNSSFIKRRIMNLNIAFYIIISSHASFIFEVITLNSSVLSHSLNLRAQIFNLSSVEYFHSSWWLCLTLMHHIRLLQHDQTGHIYFQRSPFPFDYRLSLGGILHKKDKSAITFFHGWLTLYY